MILCCRQNIASRQRGVSSERSSSTSSDDSSSGVPSADKAVVEAERVIGEDSAFDLQTESLTSENLERLVAQQSKSLEHSNPSETNSVEEVSVQPTHYSPVNSSLTGQTQASSHHTPQINATVESDSLEIKSTDVPNNTALIVTETKTKDEITDTDDLQPLSKSTTTPQKHLPACTDEYVIKTYTCQPIGRMDVREALVGTNKKFECQVIGFPPPNIRWFKDNVEITHDPRYHFSHNHEDGVVSMHIEVIKLSDAGLYQCRAENCEGYAITAAHLQVKGW